MNCEEILKWYRTYARPQLESLAPNRVQDLDKEVARLERLSARNRESIATCFLGQSQIGKSTLINAVVAGSRLVLPSGGLGPLTAQAIQVEYSQSPFFEVEYQAKGHLWRLVFALEQQLIRETGKDAGEIDADLQSEEKEDVALVVALESNISILETMKNQGKLMVTGDQNSAASTAYVVDALRLALGKQAKWNSQITVDDRQRIERIKIALSSPWQLREESQLGAIDFQRQLRDHSAGFLAPLIKSIRLGWPSSVLGEGLTLVDLPGVGIADDAHRAVTHEWIGQKATTVCLVVTSAGVDVASADLLRSTRFLNRLLHASDDFDADPVHLVVVVVQMDNLAYAKYQEERQLNPDSARKRSDHLRDVVEKMPDVIRGQLGAQLERLANEEEGAARAALLRAKASTLERLQIFPLTALEYYKLLNDDGAFIRSEAESGVPAFRDALAGFVKYRRHTLEEELQSRALLFRQQVATALKSLHAEWSDAGMEDKEAERIRRLLQEFIAPKKKEGIARKAEFRSYLKKTVPLQIDALVAEASNVAERAMTRYVRVLEDAHWATLKAVVRRGGAFHGAKKIDLPYELALKFETQVAPIWSEKIIASVRKESKQLAEAYVAMIEEIVAWASENGARSQVAAVQALAEQIRADSKVLVEIGKDSAEELREKVKAQLMKGITEPIRKKCQKFVSEGQADGRGVKRRILELFADEMIPLVVSAAAEPTRTIMKTSFQAVEAEIREAFDKYPNPSEQAEELIVRSHVDSEKRSRAQRKKAVIAGLETALQTLPPQSQAGGLSA